MRYLKKYEDLEIDPILDKKLKEYEKYINKYILYEYKHTINICQFLTIWSTPFQSPTKYGYYVEISNFEWDDFYDGWIVSGYSIHLDDFNIVGVFDNMKDATEEYKTLQDAKKYNL
jgi:hypothetical protein